MSSSSGELQFVPSLKGGLLAVLDSYTFHKNSSSGKTSYFLCSRWNLGCRVKVIVYDWNNAKGTYSSFKLKNEHGHPPDPDNIERLKAFAELKEATKQNTVKKAKATTKNTVQRSNNGKTGQHSRGSILRNPPRHYTGEPKCDVCLFCLSDMPVQRQTSLDMIVPYGPDLEITLNNPSKNKEAFYLFCNLLSMKWSSKNDTVNLEKALPLCFQCQNLYQELYQLQVQIKELQQLLEKRVVLIKDAIRKSEKKWNGQGRSAQLDVYGLGIVRQNVLSVGNEGITNEKISAQAEQLPSLLQAKEEVYDDGNSSAELVCEDEFNFLLSDAESSTLPPTCTAETERDDPSDFDANDMLWEDEDGESTSKSETENVRTDVTFGLGNDEEAELHHRRSKGGVDNATNNDANIESTCLSRSKRSSGKDLKQPTWWKTIAKKKRLLLNPRKRATTRTCHICEETFSNRRTALLLHYNEKHPDEKRYTCKFCKRHCKSLAEVIRHQTTHTGDRVHECQQCSKRFVLKSSLTLHVKTVHDTGDGRRFQCGTCEKSYPLLSMLKDHEDIHIQTLVFCKICGKRFKSTKTFRKHNEKFHKSTADCTAPMLNPTDKDLHAIGINASTQNTCNICGINIHGSINIKKHFDEFHDGHPPCKCPKCGMQFRSYRQTRFHVIRHSDIKTFQCDKCPRRFHFPTELKYHSQTHVPKADRPKIICDLCGKFFAVKSSLVNHYKVHETNRTPWVCEICGKSYSQRKGYLYHKKAVHLKLAQHKCTYCPAAFIGRGSLVRHLLTHTGKSPHKCPHCDKCFLYTASRARHVREVHFHFSGRKRNYKSKQRKVSTPVGH